MPNTSKGSIYSSTPSRPSVENINPPFQRSTLSGNVLSPKISPHVPHKSTSKEFISSEISPCFSGRKTISTRTPLSSSSKTEFILGSSEKESSSSPNIRDEKFDEAVIILENEPGTSGTNRSSFFKENSSGSNSENRIFSPRKVSPWKVSKLKSPSFKDFEVLPGSPNRSVNSGQRCSDVYPFLKDSSVSSDVSQFPNSNEVLSHCYVSSPKARPEISNYDKEKSLKRNLECSLNDDIYPMHSLSSPEILVCDSDNELEQVLEKSSLSKSKHDWEKECSSNQEVKSVLCNENYGTPDSVFISKFKESSSSCSKEKTVLPELICCSSDSDDDANVTVELPSTRERNNTNFDETSELKEPELIQYDDFSIKNKNECTSVRTNTNNPILDVIDCCSNSNDNADIMERLQSSNQTKEATDEDEYIPLSERIVAAKSNANSYKPFKDLEPSSPESPWTFQTDKHCGDKPLEKGQNILKSSASTSQQNYDSTPKHPPKKLKSKNSAAGHQTEKVDDGKNEGSSESQNQSSPKSSKNLALPKKRKQTNETSDQPSKKTVKSDPKTTTQANEAATKITSKSKNFSSTKPSSSSGQTHPLETKTSSPDISSSPDGSNNSRENYFNLSSDFSDCSQPDSKENITNVSQYILSNDELYKKVLTYSPLNLMEFQHELKESGIFISINNLMDYLDEQCITFTCPRKEEYKKKQQARTQRFRKRMIAKMSQQKS